jgi:predicted dehydrogenase
VNGNHLFASVVGTGFIGPVHVEGLRRLGRPVLGVLGSSLPRGREAADRLNISRVYETLDELLADPMCGVVHVTSPNRHHFEQCRRILAAGKHLICEKPLAMTSAETAELVRLAAASNVVTAVNYNVRYYPMNLESRARAAGGRLGRIFHVTGSYVQDWLLRDTDFNWRVLADEGGASRAVADIGTHWMDLMTHITGQPIEAVCADLGTVHPTRYRPAGPVETFATAAGTRRIPVAIDTEDHGSILLRFKGGATGCLTVSQVTAGRKNCLRYEVAAEEGSLAWDSERPEELWLGRREEPSALMLRDPAQLAAEARAFTSYPGGHAEGFGDTFKQLFKAVYGYIEAGDFAAPRPFPTFEDGHREVLLVEAIVRSHRERRWVEV